MIWVLVFVYLMGAYTTAVLYELAHNRTVKFDDVGPILFWPVSMTVIFVLDMKSRLMRRAK